MRACKESRRQESRVEALWDIAEAQAQAGEKEAARATRQAARTAFAEALEAGQNSEWGQQWEEALAPVAVTLAQAGKFAAALQIAQKIAAASKAAQRRWWKEISTRSELTEVLVAIAIAQAQAGEREVARETFAIARKTARGLEREASRAGALESIATAQAQVGEVAAALETTRMIEAAYKQVEALASIAAAQAQAGDKEAVRTFLAAAFETGQRLEWAELPVEALALIAVAQARVGDKEAAQATFAAAFKEAEESQERYKMSALYEIAAAQAQVREFAAAFETAQRIEDADLRADALVAIAAAQAQAGEKEAAGVLCELAFEIVQQEAAERMQGVDLDAKKLAQAGQFTAALQYARENPLSPWLVGEIGVAWVRAGHKEEARAEFFDEGEAMQIEKEIRTGDDLHLLEVVVALAQAGDKTIFKRLLIPCAYSPGAAYRMCGLLALVYPEQAEAVAEVVMQER